MSYVQCLSRLGALEGFKAGKNKITAISTVNEIEGANWSHIDHVFSYFSNSVLKLRNFVSYNIILHWCSNYYL